MKSKTKKPVVLCILDGWGISEQREGNAPLLAHTPNFDRLMESYPNSTLITHGPDSGLPTGQMGNSEVGHTNIGAGRVVAMDLGRIDLAIEDRSFFENEEILNFAGRVKSAGGKAHLLGVMSDGGVHGHLNHLIAAAEMLTNLGLEVSIHAITDGRDVPPKSAANYLVQLESQLPEGATIASILGRYYALDRDNRWERVQKAYSCIIRAQGLNGQTPGKTISSEYANGRSDEFFEPTALSGPGVQDGDGVFCLNFRADRAREIMAAIADPQFDAFDVSNRPKLSAVLGMAEYSKAHNAFMQTAYPKADIKNTLGAWVAKSGMKQFRVAETEKYPHVTFFLNGLCQRHDPRLGSFGVQVFGRS